MTSVPMQQKVLSENDKLAAVLRTKLTENRVLCLNLISSPGSGKTRLLERTLEALAGNLRAAVITGDLQTDRDAARLSRFGFPVKQITTGGTCHLDARMIETNLADWNIAEIDVLFIENVGNLVCPSSYDLGEDVKIVVLSVPEGEEKPLKYPSIFFRSELLIINKIDLLPYVPFDLTQAKENALKVHPEMTILELSCQTGEGLDRWVGWIRDRVAAKRGETPSV